MNRSLIRCHMLSYSSSHLPECSMTMMILSSFHSANERFACDPKSWHLSCPVCQWLLDWFVYCIRRHKLVQPHRPMWLLVMTMLHHQTVVRERIVRMIQFDLHSYPCPLYFGHLLLLGVMWMVLYCLVVALMFDRFAVVDLVHLHPLAMSNHDCSQALRCHVLQRPQSSALPIRWSWTYCQWSIGVSCDRRDSEIKCVICDVRK